MANIAFGNKYFILSKFSSIPKTSKIEQDRANFIKEFEDFEAYKSSDELLQFEELAKYIESAEHKAIFEKIRKGKGQEEAKIKSLEAQKKSKKIKSYFKFKEGQKLKDFLSFSESKDLEKYKELKNTVTSGNFSAKKSQLEKTIQSGKNKDKSKKSEQSDQQTATAEKQLSEMVGQESEYKKLTKSKAIKFYFKFKDSTRYKEFTAFKNSKELADYLALEKYINSSEHKEKLENLISQETEENKKVTEYNSYKKSKKYTWYQGLKGSDKFNALKKWKVVFEDDFSNNTLNKEQWMTRYYWGDKLVNDAYALEMDQAFPTDGNNIEINNTLKIVTKKENIEGKKWKIPFGFIPQEFNYTTGLISTAKSFRLKYGKIEAKIRVNFAKPVNYNFWMASEQNLPHVDIMKLGTKKTKVDVGLAYGNITDPKGPTKNSAAFSGLDVAQDFFIYTLEWTKDKLIWKINGIVVHEQTKGVPKEEMYLVFSSGITGKAVGTGLPASMEVDWVRCYQEA